MEKIIAIFLMIISLFTNQGQTQGVLNNGWENSDIEALRKAQFEISERISELIAAENIGAESEYEVVKEQVSNGSYYDYLYLIIKNTSQKTLSIEVKVTFFDEKGEIVGVKNDTVSSCGAGYSCFLAIPETEDFHSYEYAIETKKAFYSTAAQPYVNVNVRKTGEKLIIEGTNTGIQEISLPQFIIVFFDKNDNILDYEYGFFDTLKPGASSMKEERVTLLYDHYEIFIEGFIY